MSASLRASIRCRVSSLSRQHTTTKSASRISASSGTMDRAEPRDRRGVGVGIGDDHAPEERPREPEDLLADAAGADEAERAAGQALAHEAGALVPAAGLHQLVLLEQPAGQREDHGQRRHRNRPAHGDRRVGDDDAFRRRGRQIDGVVADAVAGDDLQPAVAAREACRRHARQVDVQAVVARGDRPASPRQILAAATPMRCRGWP